MENIANFGKHILAWTEGVQVEDSALQQLHNVASLPFVGPHIAVMPDVHAGKGATIGSVIPTKNAIIPAAVGVDIGCGVMAVETNLSARHLPDNLHNIRCAIEEIIPHGRTHNGDPSCDRGAYSDPPLDVVDKLGAGEDSLIDQYSLLCDKHPKIRRGASPYNHMGTLGTGNHFIEICIDESDRVWAMLHSGSRGPGNRIGTYFISKAKEEMEKWCIDLPDKDLAYLPESHPLFHDYFQGVYWAQRYARANRALMMRRVLNTLSAQLGVIVVDVSTAINCHHNYVTREKYNNTLLYITRKGAISAKVGELGVIPGSMGAKSYIVRGKGNRASFCSCSHGAGRAMSRTAAKKLFTIEQHEHATRGIECRKDAEILDETPGAYKDVEAVMQAQADLVEIVHTLKQVVNVKG